MGRAFELIPGYTLAWAEDEPWCPSMADCRQDAGWPAEGDAWTHTKMVCAQLPRFDEWAGLTDHERTVLLVTVRFHDAATPMTLQVGPVTGRDQRQAFDR